MTHQLDDARGQLREGHTSAQWELIAREKVVRTLLETGEFTADALADLNIPVEYRRHVHGAATGHYAGAEPFMDFVGRQKSARPSRKGAKNDLYTINAKGRREPPRILRDLQRELPKLAGSGADRVPGGVSDAGSPASSRPASHVGIASSQTVGHDTREAGDSGDSSGALGVVSGEQSDAGQLSGKRDQGGPVDPSSSTGIDSPDSLSSLDGTRKAPNAYDPWSDAA